MKIELRLGSVGTSDFSALSKAEIKAVSETALNNKILSITDKVTEVTTDSLYIASEDNSLAEMMAASRKGASAVLCTKAPASMDNISGVAVIVCEDILKALSEFAKAYTEKNGKHKTVAITGSHGKTLAGEHICSVLEEMYKVSKATDNAGGELSDIKALLEISPDAEFFLFEMKPSGKADVKRLAKLISLDAGVITDYESKISSGANYDILNGIRPDGEIFVNADAGNFDMKTAPANFKAVSQKQNECSALKAVNVKELGESTVFDIVGAGLVIRQAEIHTHGENAVSSALLAAAIGIKYGIPEEKIKTGLKNCHSSASGVEISTVGGVTFMVDASSATPESVKNGIDELCGIAKIHSGSRMVAIVGDIRDFGQDTRLTHEKMGAYIFKCGINKLFTFGVAAEFIGKGAVSSGMPKEDVSGNLELFSPLKTAEAAAKVIKKGDILLIRMGRKNACEEIVGFLKKHCLGMS